jgi:hypothetical protein
VSCKYAPHGSLTVYFQSANPGKDMGGNPRPRGAFNLMLWLSAPKSEALTGKWNLPAVSKIEACMGLSGQ